MQVMNAKTMVTTCKTELQGGNLRQLKMKVDHNKVQRAEKQKN